MCTQSEEVRGRIVEAAYESFWRLGFRRSIVDAIAGRAGLTKRTVYAYFRSKDDLLAAVLQRYEELAVVRLARIGDRMPADRIGLIDSFFAQLRGWAGTTPRWSGSGFTSRRRTRRFARSSGPRHRAPRQGEDRIVACRPASRRTRDRRGGTRA